MTESLPFDFHDGVHITVSLIIIVAEMSLTRLTQLMSLTIDVGITLSFMSIIDAFDKSALIGRGE